MKSAAKSIVPKGISYKTTDESLAPHRGEMSVVISKTTDRRAVGTDCCRLYAVPTARNALFPDNNYRHFAPMGR